MTLPGSGPVHTRMASDIWSVADLLQPVFHKTVVITDRTALDQQLQRTIFQSEMSRETGNS